MKLRQTLEHPINGYWDGGQKQVFEWIIENISEDKKGKFVKIGSWEANHWFHVAMGKTEKLTLSYAKRRLKLRVKRYNIKSTFEYTI